MRRKFIIAVLLISLSLSQYAKAVNINNVTPSTFTKFVISPGMGIGISRLALGGLEYLDDYLPVENSFAIASKTLLRNYLAFQVVLLNHEIFGHGARYIEVDVPVDIKISWFDGSVKGYQDPHVSDYQDAIVSAAGNAVNNLLGESLKRSMIANDSITPTKSAGYIFAQGNQAAYIYWIDNNYLHKGGGDITHYTTKVIKAMSFTKNTETFDELYDRIGKLGILDFLDPFVYYTLYSNFANKTFKVPMLQLAEGLEYLPATRLIMAPYGLEAKLINYFRTSYTPFQIYLSMGDNFGLKSYGAGVLIDTVLKSGPINIGLDVRAWAQPDFINEKAEIVGGYLGMVNISYDMTKNIQPIVGIGYKTAGFQQDYSVEASMIWSLGCNVAL